MHAKCHSSLSRHPSRHDRSRSPCREPRPWEQGGEPKSVLYSADVQFHQRRMLQRSRRSPMKQSPSPIKNRTTKSATSSPLKDTSTHTALRAHHWDSEQSLQNVANRWQRWHQMYSPPKFMAGLRSGDGYSPDTIPSRNTPKRGGNRPWSVSYPWNDAEIFDENCDYENHSIEKSHPSKENIRRIEKPRVRNRSTSHTMVPERSNLNHITTHQRIRSKSPALEENHRNGNVEPMDARAPVTVTPMQDSFSSPHRQDPVEQLTPGTAVSPGEVFYTPMTHLRPADERNMSLPAASLSPTVTPARPRFSLINEKVLTVGSHTSGSIKENTEAHLAVYDEVSRRLDFTLQQARETLSKSMRSSAFDVDRSVFGGTKEEHGTQTSSCGPDAQAPAVDKETNIPTPREEKEQQPNLRDPMKALLQRNSDATMERINNILCRKTIENDRDNAECSTDIPLPKALGACMSAELSSAEKIWRARLQLSKTRHLAKKYNERLEQAQRSRNADIDEVLNTISLHDASLEVIDSAPKLPVPVRESSSATVSETTSEVSKMSTVSRKQQPEDMQTRAINELRTYQRMQKRLVEVQLRVIMLRKKLLSSSVDYCAYLDRFKEAVVEECKKSLRESNALQKILSMEDLLLEVKRRERKVVDASFSWAEAMKQSLNRDSPDFYKLPEVPFTGRSVSIRLESKAEERPAKAQNRGVPEAQTRGPTANGDATDLSARSMRRILDARREHVEVMNRRLEEEEKCIEKMTKESIAAQIAKHDKVIVEQNDLMNQLKRLSIGEQYEEPPPRTPTPRRDGVAPLDLSLLSNDSPQEESKHPSELIDEPAVAVQVEHAALEMVPEDVALNRTRSQSTVYEDSLSHFSDENDRPPSDDTLYQSDEAPDAGDVTQNASPQPSRRTLDTAETLAMLSRSIVGVAVTETPRMEAVQELESIVNEASAENKAQLEKTAQAKVEPPHLPSSSNVSRELESIDQKASAENEAHLEKIAQEETPVEGRPLISSPVAPPEVDLTPAAELQPQGVPELSRNVSDDKEDVKKEMEVLQSPQARTAEPAKDGNFDEYVEDDWLSSDNDESPNEATATGPAPPPKNFSRLRLFFGSPDEPTKDNVDAEEPEDESTNDQFDSRMEPTSAIGDEETKADENDEAEATSGDELVPRITLRKFVYKEPVIGEVYKEDTDLQPTQWETTPPDTPPVEPLGGAHVVQEEAVREEIVFDRSAWVPEGNALQKRQAKETSEKPDDTHKNVAAEEKMAGDQKGPEIDLSKEPASAPGDGDSTAQIIPSGPVSAPQAELSTSMICLEKAPVELPPTQDPAALAALGAGDSTAQIMPSGPVSGVQDEPRTSRMSPIRTPVAELPPSQDADESPFLARISDMGLNRSDLCDSLSASMMQILESPRRTSVSQSPRYRYALSDSLLEDSTLDVSAGTPKSPKERFTTKLPRTGMSPEYRSFLNESAENSLLDYIVKSETNAALINEKVEKIEEEIVKLRSPDWGERNKLEGSLDETYEDLFSIKCSSELLEWDYVQEEFQPVSSLRGRLLAKLEPEVSVSTEAERLGEVTPNAALEVQATTLVEPLDESYEDLMSVKEPPSLLHRLHSPSEPSANAVAKYAADTPRKQATRELSPEALKQDRLEKLRERLESVELKTKTCEQLAEKAWNLIQSQGFMLLSYDSFVPVPESADDIIVDSEDERMLLENHRMTIWTAITEFSAMLWPEHSVRVGLVSTKWLPKPKTAEEFREMAVKYVIEQTSELPPSHRFKRQSRLLPVEENVDADEAAIDEAVARSNCISSSAFARKVHAKYRELCEELVIKVGDLFIASELLHANLLSSADDSLLSQSGDISHISGDFGRPSLARLSIVSGVSIGRTSTSSAVAVKLPPIELSE